MDPAANNATPPEPLPSTFPSDNTRALIASMLDALLRGQKIESIKIARHATGCSLNDGKVLADGLSEVLARYGAYPTEGSRLPAVVKAEARARVLTETVRGLLEIDA